MPVTCEFIQSRLVNTYAQISWHQNAGCAPSLRMLIRCNVQACVNVECNAAHNARFLQQSVDFPRNALELIPPRVYVINRDLLASYTVAWRFNNLHATSLRRNSHARIRSVKSFHPNACEWCIKRIKNNIIYVVCDKFRCSIVGHSHHA